MFFFGADTFADEEESTIEAIASGIKGQIRRVIFDDEHEETDSRSAQSVESDLHDSNTIKPAIFEYDPIESHLTGFYDFSRGVNDSIGLRFTSDYSALFQQASSTISGDREAASYVFRVLGTWLRVGERERNSGVLVWKVEVRDRFGDRQTPRQLGFDTGSALSTANFKEQDFGVTDLYWKQRFQGGKYTFLVGHMDPGDWADQHPLLNAWTSFMNDAFYNNPSQAIPSRGFGIVGQAIFAENFYAMAGVSDANGKGSELDFASFVDTREWFSWFELGYRGERDIMARRNTHLNIWLQDARIEEDIDSSWGIVFTHSVTRQSGAVAFVRAGYSEGRAAQLRRFVGVGASRQVFGRDHMGCGVSWGSPPEKSLRDQYTSECFYRLQVTQILTITPDIQVTYNPSFNPDKDWVSVVGLRLRISF